MAKNFDNEAYLQKWDGKIAGAMAVFIVASIIGVFWMNHAAKPDCTTHDYVFCGTELNSAGETGAGEHGSGAPAHTVDPHGAGAHGAAPAGDGHDHGAEGHGDHAHEGHE